MAFKKIVSFLIVVLELLLITQIVWADTTGEVNFEFSYSPESGELDGGANLNLKYTDSISDQHYLTADLLFNYPEEDFNLIRINEAFVQGIQTPWEEVDYRLGLLQITWGASDIMSPVDVVNPRPFSLSFTEEALEEKLPIPSLNLEWYHSFTWWLEFLYQPYFVANYIPHSMEENMLVNQLAHSLTVDPSQLELSLSKENPQVDFLHPIWGIRTQGMLGNIDVALSYFQGYYLSSYPYQTQITYHPDGTLSSQVNSGYPRKTMVGLEFQGEFPLLEGSTFRGDLALFVPERWINQIIITQPDGTVITNQEGILNEPYWKASFGIDYTTEQDVVLNTAFVLGNPYEEGKDVSPYLFLSAEKTSEDGKWTPFITSGLSLWDGSMVNAVGTRYQPETNWEVSFTYTFSSGSPQSKLGAVGDGFFLGIEHVF